MKNLFMCRAGKRSIIKRMNDLFLVSDGQKVHHQANEGLFQGGGQAKGPSSSG